MKHNQLDKNGLAIETGLVNKNFPPTLERIIKKVLRKEKKINNLKSRVATLDKGFPR